MAIKNHEPLDFTEFQNWLASQEFTYASRTIDKNQRLTLNVTANGNHIVRVGATIYWQGLQPFTAIEKFNELA